MAAFMKLGDIRGESVVAPDRADQDYVVEGNGDQVAQFTTGGGGDSVYHEPDTSDPGPGNRSNWDVICDLGTAIKQTSVADALTDYRPEGFSGVEIHFATENLDSRLINHDDFLLVNNVGSTSLQENCANGTFLQENCANGTFLQENCANGNWLNKGQQGEGFVINDGSIAQHWSMVNQDNMQGFDAGGMNYAEAVGLDSSIFDVMNKVGGSANPGSDDI